MTLENNKESKWAEFKRYSNEYRQELTNPLASEPLMKRLARAFWVIISYLVVSFVLMVCAIAIERMGFQPKTILIDLALSFHSFHAIYYLVIIHFLIGACILVTESLCEKTQKKILLLYHVIVNIFIPLLPISSGILIGLGLGYYFYGSCNNPFMKLGLIYLSYFIVILVIGYTVKCLKNKTNN